jgi:hypothetical protein
MLHCFLHLFLNEVVVTTLMEKRWLYWESSEWCWVMSKKVMTSACDTTTLKMHEAWTDIGWYMNRQSFSICLLHPSCSASFRACNKNRPNTPSNHDDAPQPKQYTLIVRPTHNQSTPNLLHPPPNNQRHRLMCLYHQSIHHRLCDSHRHQRHQKICTSISEAIRCPSTSCGDKTNLLLRSNDR